MADFKPAESAKARILSLKPAPADLPLDDANSEWIEIRVELDSDLANWRVAHLRALWRAETAKPIEWEWIYTFGSPHFAKAGEIYRVHSGSVIRAATHPVADDLTPGRKHVYVAGPVRAGRLLWTKGDYARLVDAFGTVIDEVVAWPEERPAATEAPRAGARPS
ncbi:MAG: hypothetical protein KGN00_08885 [Chloroflexota bacterium]|nr:hypothetical protein [Chloroflexota bacterium]MDE3193785.1 hypothetical protein [Chloroflexota bacterium]